MVNPFVGTVQREHSAMRQALLNPGCVPKGIFACLEVPCLSHALWWGFRLEIFAHQDITALLAQHSQKRCLVLLAPGMNRGEARMPECSVETGDYPLQVAPAGQDSSAQQEQVSQILMEPQTRVLVARAHLDTFAQLAQVCHSHALQALTHTGAWEKGGPCPVSHFCPEGTSFPLPCLAGTYNDLTRQAACFPCAAGYYCPENATSYTMNPCPAGFYCPKGTKFATEFPCPRGYYNPDPMTQSLDSCLPCPPGHYCGKENLTAVSGKCDAGWFCVSAAWTSQPFDLDNYTNANCLCPATATGGKCLAGFYCPRGSPEPLPCPPGLYCNASGLSVPSGQCTAGFYCSGGAALPQPTDGATGNICPVGTYCPAGSAVPEPCPAGTFSSVPGQRMLSKCQPCPSGFFCKTPGLSAPTGECQEGDAHSCVFLGLKALRLTATLAITVTASKNQSLILPFTPAHKVFTAHRGPTTALSTAALQEPLDQGRN
ncbi:PREDICTED: uncharacterized protein LOC104575254 [Tinamus guttatus]|uniref:uncharacterized protein LOC104575254 n=1 Tax=Tinamus guttatus TaxID=94827 RepID=UPI00052E9A88|nr:PREDICTED: uncharacterized protein LOC104575254 [Tinamus guttatus]